MLLCMRQLRVQVSERHSFFFVELVNYCFENYNDQRSPLTKMDVLDKMHSLSSQKYLHDAASILWNKIKGDEMWAKFFCCQKLEVFDLLDCPD